MNPQRLIKLNSTGRGATEAWPTDIAPLALEPSGSPPVDRREVAVAI